MTHVPLEESITTELRSQHRWDEDLRGQAARLAEIGRSLCTCEGKYHALWGGLRAANLEGKQESEVPVLAATLSPLIQDGTRVLIGGSADPGLLCKIGRLCGEHRTDLTIVERCPAPLKLIEEFAAHRNISCRTILSDILNLERAMKWDIILLHYTITFVERAFRERFFDRLARSLAPNGTLICMIRTGPARDPGEIKMLESAYFDENREALRRHQLDTLWPDAERDDMLRSYAAARAGRRVCQPGVEEIAELFQSAGLVMVSEIGTGLKRVLERSGNSSADSESSSIVLARHRRA